MSEIDTNEIVERKTSKNKKKITPKKKDIIVTIPTYENYNVFLKKKHTLIQLKQICKFYKLHVTGNKNELSNRIYNHLLLSYNASIVQYFWRKHCAKRFARLHGPSQFNRDLCVNETDFYSMDELKDIPYTQFFSYKDIDNMVYGFDIMSFYTLINSNEDEFKLNPYTRNPISKEVINDFNSLLTLSKIFREDIQLESNEPDENILIAQSEHNEENGYNIQYRAVNLFYKIDDLGHYTNPMWFIELKRTQLLIYVSELYDIWTYRAQLNNQVKYEISPNGNPFLNIHIAELPYLHLLELKHIVLSLMETLVNQGINQNSQYLGSTYVLCALTLVNVNTAEAMPWLYESVALR